MRLSISASQALRSLRSALLKVMGFPRWFISVTFVTLNSACHTIGKFSLDQALKRLSEVCCVKFESGQGFPNSMLSSSSA